jgi:hypothetical protein
VIKACNASSCQPLPRIKRRDPAITRSEFAVAAQEANLRGGDASKRCKLHGRKWLSTLKLLTALRSAEHYSERSGQRRVSAALRIAFAISERA